MYEKNNLENLLFFNHYINIMDITFFLIVMIFLFNIIVLILNKYNILKNNFINVIKIFSIGLLLINTINLLIKFYYCMQSQFLIIFSRFHNKTILENKLDHNLDFFLLNYSVNSLGLALLLLCYFVTLVVIYYLHSRGLSNNNLLLTSFLFFIICTTILVTTDNIIILFFSFELIFLPSLYFAYKLGYVKKVDQSVYFLLLWTLFGSLAVFFCIIYVYNTTGLVSFELLKCYKFTSFEKEVLYFFVFLGYGVKIPLFPFYYWLIKVHVEAPAGFSMFLSGYLVKTALYCLWNFQYIFSDTMCQKFALIISLITAIESSLKMWSQVDIKKIVALATVQEMSLIVVPLVATNNLTLIATFVFMHGILSVLMFFLVDQFQKKFGTRNCSELSGSVSELHFLKISTWFMLVFFNGLPFTPKFFMEVYICGLLYICLGFLGFIIFIWIVCFGIIGFSKPWLAILSLSKTISKFKDKKDLSFSSFLVILFCFFLLILIPLMLIL